MSDDGQERELTKGIVPLGGTWEKDMEITRLRTTLESVHDISSIREDLAVHKERDSNQKREIRSLKSQLRTLQREIVASNPFLRFCLYMGSLIFIESIAIWIDRHFPEDNQIIVFIIIGAIFSLGILSFIYLVPWLRPRNED